MIPHFPLRPRFLLKTSFFPLYRLSRAFFLLCPLWTLALPPCSSLSTLNVRRMTASVNVFLPLLSITHRNSAPPLEPPLFFLASSLSPALVFVSPENFFPKPIVRNLPLFSGRANFCPSFPSLMCLAPWTPPLLAFQENSLACA